MDESNSQNPDPNKKPEDAAEIPASEAVAPTTPPPAQPPAQEQPPQQAQPSPNEVFEETPAQPVDVTPPAQPAPEAAAPTTPPPAQPAAPVQTEQPPQPAAPAPQEPQAIQPPSAAPEDAGLSIEDTPAEDSAVLSDTPPPTTNVPAAQDTAAFDAASGLSLEDDSDDEGAATQANAAPAEVTAEEKAANEAAAALSLDDDEDEVPSAAPAAAEGSTAAAAAAPNGQPAPMSQPIPKGLDVPYTDDGPAEYEYKIHGQPEFAMVTVQLPSNRRLKLEAAAMVSMDTNVVMRTRAKGGLKRMLSGNSLFINEFIAEQFPGTISFANGMPGDVRQYFLNGNEPLYLSSGAFLGCGDNIQIHTEYQGMAKGFFSSTGLFMTQCEGKGSVFFSSYGGILEIDVKDEYLVDNDHIVAYTGGLQQNLEKFGGYKSLLFSGEGLVSRFTGEGKLWIQTRKIPKFTSWVSRYRRQGKGINIDQVKSMLGK